MNKFLILAVSVGISSVTVHAQDKTIKEVNREYASKYEEIGRDRSLSGYEKGMKKRELALEHRKTKREALGKKYPNSPKGGDLNYEDYERRERMKDQIEEKIDRLENEYDRKKDMLDAQNISKEDKKMRKKELEREFKRAKESLKREKDRL